MLNLKVGLPAKCLQTLLPLKINITNKTNNKNNIFIEPIHSTVYTKSVEKENM